MAQIRNRYTNGFFGAALASAALLHVSFADAASEVVLYSFQDNGVDGYEPYAPLINVDGTLYGTTYFGGAAGVGAVFSIDTTTGAETVVYSFQNNGADGANPVDGLINIKGTLYGTTYSGGAKGVGTVFKVSSATGKEKVIYSFCSVGGTCEDGYDSRAGLTLVGAALYGTTSAGGTADGGSVFSVNRTTGVEAVIYSFQRDGSDGNTPYAGMINAGGTLYGTTKTGGTSGAGTVFSLDPQTGGEKVLYSFAGGTDGDQPFAGLIDVNGALYGTTLNGGPNNDGTVFKIDPATGAETLLHSFTGDPDGFDPEAGLTNVKGSLYGTTYLGGANVLGTVFRVNTKTGAEKVVYSFCSQPGCADGEGPLAGLIEVGGALYGTTNLGGTYGHGTVFKVELR